ncbi:hypothetical protein [Humibacter ginsengisoli]
MTDPQGRPGGITAGRTVGAVAAGVVASVVLWFFGVDLGFACAIGFLTIAIGLAWAAYSGPSAVRWPFERPTPRPGTRSDVSRLAWGFQMRRGSVREPGFKAVRELAAVRLARFGLDLSSAGDRDAIVALIGEPSYAALNPVRGVLPSVAQLVGCLDVLDGLSDAPSTPDRRGH